MLVQTEGKNLIIRAQLHFWNVLKTIFICSSAWLVYWARLGCVTQSLCHTWKFQWGKLGLSLFPGRKSLFYVQGPVSPGLFPQQKHNSGMQHIESTMKTFFISKARAQSCSCFHACVQNAMRCCSSPCVAGRTGMGILSGANKENFPSLPQVPSQRLVLKWRCRSWPEGEFAQIWSCRAPVQGEEPAWAGQPLVPGLVKKAEQRGNQQQQMGNFSFFKKLLTEGSCSLPSEHYATVALTFQDLVAQSELELECKGVPVSHEESTRQCWKKQYFEEIHLLLQQSKDNMEW